MFVKLVLLAIGFLLVWDYLTKRHRNAVLNRSRIPGPTALPILGNALHVKHVTTENMMGFVRECKEKYGKIYGFWMLHQATVFLLDVKYLEVVFASQQLITKARVYDFIEGWLGRGLL